MKDQNSIQRMRANLQPKGTAPIVLLNTLGSAGMEMSAEFVQKCIDELEQIPVRVVLDSAYIDPKHEAKQEEFMRKEGLIG